MKKSRSSFQYFIAGAVAALLILLLVFFLTNTTATAESLTEDFPQVYKIVSPEIPDYIEFAGE